MPTRRTEKICKALMFGMKRREQMFLRWKLSAHQRPAWDLRVLRGLGMQAAADTEIWKQVWTKEERINNASTPMFLVEGRKCPLLQ